MNVTRRALLGTLIGAPLGCMVAQGKSPEIGEIKVTAISSPHFSQQRIVDIGDAFLSNLERNLIFKGIRYTDTVDTDWPACWGHAFIIPSAYSEESIRAMLRDYIMPCFGRLSNELIKYHNSKCRYYGVDIRRHQDGLAVWVSYSHDEEKPFDADALYSTWRRAL